MMSELGRVSDFLTRNDFFLFPLHSVDAETAIASIDTARGPMETLYDVDTDTYYAAPIKTWQAQPVELKDGTWGIAWASNLKTVEGTTGIMEKDCVLKTAADMVTTAVEI